MDVAPDQAVLDAVPGRVDDAALQHDAVLDLRAGDPDTVTDAGVGADERVHQAASRADHRRTADGCPDQLRPRPDPHAAGDAACRIQRALDTAPDLVQDHAVRLQHIILLA